MHVGKINQGTSYWSMKAASSTLSFISLCYYLLPLLSSLLTSCLRAVATTSSPADIRRDRSPRKLELRNTNHPNRSDILQGTSLSPSRARMAEQTKAMQEKAQNATKGTPASSVQHKVNSTTDSALSSIDYYGNWIAQRARGMLDSVFPPEKRAAFLSKLQAFMLANPKLSVSQLLNSFKSTEAHLFLCRRSLE